MPRSISSWRFAAEEDAKECGYPHDASAAETPEPQQVGVTGHDEIRGDLLSALENAIVRGVADSREVWRRFDHLCRPTDRLERRPNAVFAPVELGPKLRR